MHTHLHFLMLLRQHRLAVFGVNRNINLVFLSLNVDITDRCFLFLSVFLFFFFKVVNHHQLGLVVSRHCTSSEMTFWNIRLPRPQILTMTNGSEKTFVTDDRWCLSRIDALCITAIYLKELFCWIYSCSSIDLTSVMCGFAAWLVLDWPWRVNDWVLSLKLVPPTVLPLNDKISVVFICVGGVRSL